MRRLLLCLLCLGLSFTSICEAETFSPVRLHVVADSNEPEAQRLKLLVRDRVALETRALLASAHSEAEACAILREKAAYLRAGKRIRRARRDSAGTNALSGKAVWNAASARGRVRCGARGAGRGGGAKLVVRAVSVALRARRDGRADSLLFQRAHVA